MRIFKAHLPIVFFILSPLILNAQFSFTGELRPRAEYRHGYKTLLDSLQQPGVFVSQRTRLNFGYAKEKLVTMITVQDVRTWGNQSQLNSYDVNTYSLHQAWAEYSFNNHFSMKAGRQEIIYDNERLFGGVSWTQQGRSHDALLLKYQDSTFTIHAGGAYNQTGENNTAVAYTGLSSYKELYYLWMNKRFHDLSISLVEINTGYQSTATINSTRFTFTAGTYISYAEKKTISVAGNFYYQGGTDPMKNEVRAYMAGAEVIYKTKSKFILTIGGELLSGQNQTDTSESYSDVKHQFNPLYSTAHKFDGYMDYYFAGSGHENVGLNDFYLKVKYNETKWWTAIDVHQFMANAEILDSEKLVQTGNYENMSNNLGIEIDLTLAYNLSQNVVVQGGYSHYLPTLSLQAVKGGDQDVTQNWAYLMITFKPDFLK